VDRGDRRNDGCEKQDGEGGPDVASHGGQFYIRWAGYSRRFRSARGSLPGAAPCPARISKPVGRSDALHPPPSSSAGSATGIYIVYNATPGLVGGQVFMSHHGRPLPPAGLALCGAKWQVET
jgi:hypothetical protein